MALERKMIRKLLKPLRRRKPSQDKIMLEEALDRLHLQAYGLHEINNLNGNLPKKRNYEELGDAKYVSEWINFVSVLYTARRISYAQFVFYAAYNVEHYHEKKWFGDQYPKLLTVKSKMNEIESRYQNNEDWTQTDLNKYKKLEGQYSKVLNNEYMLALREFGLDKLADLMRDDEKEFKRLRERGRRILVHSDETDLALKDVVLYYEDQAQKAALAGAFGAAIVAYGSGLEGLLILRCLKSKPKAIAIATSLTGKSKPQKNHLDDPTKWTFDNLIETCLTAGWLPKITTEYAEFNAAGLAHELRRMRNNVHPGKIAREQPWREVDEQDYRDAKAIYVALAAQVAKKIK